MKASQYFSLPASMPFGSFFDPEALPWEWIKQIKPALAAFTGWNAPSEIPPGVRIEGKVYIHESVRLPAFCSIEGPCWIGEGVEIRPGAFIRGNVIVGAGSVVGNSCEFKNCLLMEKVQVPHFSYVGDSVLGSGAHLGAGVILSNLRLDQKPIRVRGENEVHDTGLRKFGAIFGEQAEAGSNAAIMPGSLLGKRSLVGPLTCFSGTLEAERIVIAKNETRNLPRRD